MKLFEDAIKGIDKQIKDLKSAIKDLENEKKEIMENAGMDTEHPLRALIKKYRRVANLKPPSDEQCQTLIDLYGEAKVVETMEAMNNWKDITKKVYFYATISNWLKRGIQKAQPTGRVIEDGFTPIINKEDLEDNREKWKNIKLI